MIIDLSLCAGSIDKFDIKVEKREASIPSQSDQGFSLTDVATFAPWIIGSQSPLIGSMILLGAALARLFNKYQDDIEHIW